MPRLCRNNCFDKGLSGRQLVCRTIVGQILVDRNTAFGVHVMHGPWLITLKFRLRTEVLLVYTVYFEPYRGPSENPSLYDANARD